ncbi:MAG: MMPL family transporter [Solirubrobacteraceae bacterium]|nr:MMPL family transporter [Solirubrobacteraceae bacterium]
MFDALTRLALGRSRAVLIGAFIFFLLTAAFGAGLPSRLPAGDAFVVPAADSTRASALFEAVSGSRAAPGVFVLVDTPTGARSEEGLRRVRALSRRIEKDPSVAGVFDIRDADAQAEQLRKDGATGEIADFASKDGKLTYIAVFGKPDLDEAPIGKRLQEAFVGLDYVRIGGPAPAAQSIADQVVADLAAAEMIAFPLLFILMLFVFRGVVAALLPLILGGMTIVATLSILRLINEALPLSVFALNLTAALGLGLAIDYSLFVVSRFREELDRGLEPADAITQTLHTAGRTVLFSSLTVAAALISLLVFPQQFLYSMAISGAITALVASSVTLIALPALLFLLGRRVNSLAPKRWQRGTTKDREGFWYNLSRWVMRHAVVVTLVTSTALLALGLPFLRIEFTGIDARILPDGNVAKEIDTTLRTRFSDVGTEPISVVISQLPESGRPEVEKYVEEIEQLPTVKSVSTPTAIDSAQIWQFDVQSQASLLDEETLTLIRDIRAVQAPGPTYVAGQAARLVDQLQSLEDRLPYALAIIGTSTMIILFLMTGSVLLPIKSLIMNVLAISAAFGILVLIFQDGRLEGLLDYESQGGLESTQPLLLLALAFGLSTDYGVFLLTRIKEGRDAGLSNEEAVAIGLQRTGRIITAAAILFCVAIGAFATSKIIFIKQIGVGTSVAVLIDATIVRALLVPALMKLLGEWNWWAPKPLRTLHDKLGIDETAPELAHPSTAQPTAPLAPAVEPPPPRPL